MSCICVSCWADKPVDEIDRTFHTVFVRRGADNIPTGVCTACLTELNTQDIQHTHSEEKIAV